MPEERDEDKFVSKGYQKYKELREKRDSKEIRKQRGIPVLNLDLNRSLSSSDDNLSQPLSQNPVKKTVIKSDICSLLAKRSHRSFHDAINTPKIISKSILGLKGISFGRKHKKVTMEEGTHGYNTVNPKNQETKDAPKLQVSSAKNKTVMKSKYLDSIKQQEDKKLVEV